MEAKVKITNLKGQVWEERKDGNGDDVVSVALRVSVFVLVCDRVQTLKQQKEQCYCSAY